MATRINKKQNQSNIGAAKYAYGCQQQDNRDEHYKPLITLQEDPECSLDSGVYAIICGSERSYLAKNTCCQHHGPQQHINQNHQSQRRREIREQFLCNQQSKNGAESADNGGSLQLSSSHNGSDDQNCYEGGELFLQSAGSHKNFGNIKAHNNKALSTGNPSLQLGDEISEEIGKDRHMHEKQQYSYYYDSLPTSDAKEGGTVEQQQIGSDDEDMMMQLRDEEIALMAMQRDLYKIKKKKYNDKYSNSSSNASNTTYSIKSFGDEATFKQIREKDVEEEIKWIKIEFYIDIAILTIIILVLIFTKKRQNECGIIVREWIMVFFIIWLSKSLFNLFKIPVLRRNYESRVSFSATLFVIMNGLLVVWLIVGNILWFSDNNDCEDHDDTAWLNVTMLIILVIGYLVIAFYFLLLCTVPCIYFCSHVQNQENREDGRLVKPQRGTALTRTLSRTGFDPQVYIHGSHCKICLRPYVDDDRLTILRCNEKHFFHTECINQWVKKGNNQCPYCLAAIKVYQRSEQEKSDVSQMVMSMSDSMDQKMNGTVNTDSK